MKFEQSKPYKRIAGKGVLVHLQNGHVFSGDVYVGPEPKGSGPMTPQQLLADAVANCKKAPKPEPVKKVAKPEIDPSKKAGLFVGSKPKRKAGKRVVGKV